MPIWFWKVGTAVGAVVSVGLGSLVWASAEIIKKQEEDLSKERATLFDTMEMLRKAEEEVAHLRGDNKGQQANVN